ncbi:hypothetical protein ACTXT7_000158 [Hymenolepis weldensis]
MSNIALHRATTTDYTSSSDSSSQLVSPTSVASGGDTHTALFSHHSRAIPSLLSFSHPYTTQFYSDPQAFAQTYDNRQPIMSAAGGDSNAPVTEKRFYAQACHALIAIRKSIIGENDAFSINAVNHNMHGILGSQLLRYRRTYAYSQVKFQSRLRAVLTTFDLGRRKYVAAVDKLAVYHVLC